MGDHSGLPLMSSPWLGVYRRIIAGGLGNAEGRRSSYVTLCTALIQRMHILGQTLKDIHTHLDIDRPLSNEQTDFLDVHGLSLLPVGF
jgi:hypothetical protein